MRRAWLTCLLLPATALLVSPARAHPGLVEAALVSGTPAEVTLSVLADEDTPLVAVDFEMPAALTVLAVSSTGWTASHTEHAARLTGRTLAVGQQSQVTLRLLAAEPGSHLITAVTHSADGGTRRWDGASLLSPYPGVLVEVTGAPRPDEPTPWGRYAVQAVVFLLVVGGGVLALRRQRRPVIDLPHADPSADAQEPS